MGYWMYSATKPPYWCDGLEAKQWTGDDDRPMPSVGEETEDIREREWAELEALARDFVKTYGGAAMIRCVSEALKDRA